MKNSARVSGKLVNPGSPGLQVATRMKTSHIPDYYASPLGSQNKIYPKPIQPSVQFKIHFFVKSCKKEWTVLHFVAIEISLGKLIHYNVTCSLWSVNIAPMIINFYSYIVKYNQDVRWLICCYDSIINRLDCQHVSITSWDSKFSNRSCGIVVLVFW